MLFTIRHKHVTFIRPNTDAILVDVDGSPNNINPLFLRLESQQEWETILATKSDPDHERFWATWNLLPSGEFAQNSDPSTDVTVVR
jgi:hypothetical protein